LLMDGLLNAASGMWADFWESDAVTLVLAGVVIGFLLALTLFKVTRWRGSPGPGDSHGENTDGAVQEAGGPFGEPLYPCA